MRPVRRSRRRPPAVLVIVQNLPVPFDRRVWLECQALRAAGFEVSVVCPKGCSDPAYEVLDGIHIYKYAPAPEAHGMAGFVTEFAYSFLATLRLAVKAWRRRRFDVIQACNPPDTFWLLALFFRHIDCIERFDERVFQFHRQHVADELKIFLHKRVYR